MSRHSTLWPWLMAKQVSTHNIAIMMFAASWRVPSGMLRMARTVRMHCLQFNLVSRTMHDYVTLLSKTVQIVQADEHCLDTCELCAPCGKLWVSPTCMPENNFAAITGYCSGIPDSLAEHLDPSSAELVDGVQADMSAEPKVGDDGTISTPGAVDFFRVVNAQVRHCALAHLQHLLPCYACSKAVPHLAAFATWLDASVAAMSPQPCWADCCMCDELQHSNTI